MTFKVILNNKSGGLAMNGEDLLHILPPEIQESIENSDDEEVQQHFARSNIVYLTANQDVVDCTNFTRDELTAELEKCTERVFGESSEV
ncbi:hypothetical protein Metev_0642 [Methanohalobium evestigatum Z-7303]|uniref:Uncharacterized protein n=1 Tax=Methanohalobium evestigatum (strain ATCC BAA-1072 / DSM 3721 / NBRC 107634 / OCM 161 / Z-7303) TaxID=644295 RepID=D7E8K6_METEZ|nr:hypothetical protein [Methanohalobium evestigatum]ADI73548.1 hypothetical protein Metev_0642 [Methanohalobium evestigatum Z-7303]